MLFPTVSMGAHVSAVPNHQVGRTTSLETRYIVAAAGNLGYELDLQKLSQDEMELIKKQIAQYKRNPQDSSVWGLLQTGRSVSENQSAWNFVSEDGKQIVFSHVQILARSAYRIPTLRLRGLDPKAEYKNVETGEVFGGDELMYAGITIPRVRQDFQPQ